MKDTVKNLANDSAVSFSTGIAVDGMGGSNHTMLVILLTFLAPIIKEVLFRLIDKWSAKKSENN